MAEIQSQEALMVWIMNKLAERFGPKAILKGGMLLKLLDCPRYTNDLDYVFVPYKSKKDIVAPIIKALSELDGIKLTYTLHSTSLRMIVSFGDYKAQIEANVENTVASRDMSTASLAKVANQLPRIIRVMNLEESLAHKMAAWNERGLMRDLYDIYYFYTRLGISPDKKIIAKRLAKINSGGKIKSMNWNDFLEKLRIAARGLTEKQLKAELTGVLSPEELIGLELKIRRSVLELTDKMEFSNAQDVALS